jgi:hypothetical protein
MAINFVISSLQALSDVLGSKYPRLIALRALPLAVKVSVWGSLPLHCHVSAKI